MKSPLSLRPSTAHFVDSDLPVFLSDCGIADDIAVYDPTEKQHDANLHNLMLVARQHGPVFNLDKCHIKETKLQFFGMLFDTEGVHPDPEKMEAIRAMQEPQDTQELQTFFGIATYMAPFIPNLSIMSEPLRNLLKRDADFQWSPSHKTAFENIKKSICREILLTYFDPDKETVVQVDASLRGFGNAPVEDGKVIAFAFRALTNTVRNVTQILGVKRLPLLFLVRNFTPDLARNSQ